MEPAANFPRTVEGELAFARAQDATPDERRPGLLRSRPVDIQTATRESFDFRVCRFHDCSETPGFAPDFVRHGFAHADLSGLPRLQAALERVRVAGALGAEDEREIRRGLLGASLRLGGRRRLRVLFIAGEGLILRAAGPNGMDAEHDPNGARPGAAISVHADQDVGGTPVRQILRGAGPWIFRHDSPHGSNRFSPLFLVNLWIPLQQVTRPLALMAKPSLDRRRHQLRFELPTDSFLQRDPERRVNDIWTFLHDDAQEWWFTSEMDAARAYVFDTLGTPHGSFILPGEAAAERLCRRLRRAMDAIAAGDAGALAEAARAPAEAADARTTRALRRAIGTMEALLAEAAGRASALSRGDGAEDWSARARAAMDRVVRKSIEMRAVGLMTPEVRPFAGPRGR